MPGFQSFCPSFVNVKGLISVFPPGLILGNTFVLFELMCIFQGDEWQLLRHYTIIVLYILIHTYIFNKSTASSCYGGLSANIICFVCLFEMLKEE